MIIYAIQDLKYLIESLNTKHIYMQLIILTGIKIKNILSGIVFLTIYYQLL